MDLRNHTMVNPKKRREDMVSKFKNLLKYLSWLEEQRIKSSIHTCSVGPLL